jgi:hypothetical protein
MAVTGEVIKIKRILKRNPIRSDTRLALRREGQSRVGKFFVTIRALDAGVFIDLGLKPIGGEGLARNAGRRADKRR